MLAEILENNYINDYFASLLIPCVQFGRNHSITVFMFYVCLVPEIGVVKADTMVYDKPYGVGNLLWKQR